MKKKLIFLLFAAFLGVCTVHSQGVNPVACYTDSAGVYKEATTITDGMAPLDVTFKACPHDMGGYTPSYEWHFRRAGLSSGEAYREIFVRYEEDTQYTFVESGSYQIVLKTRLEQDGTELDSITLSVTISDSWLEFPNAFSPNDDDINDTYRAKKGWRNIVSFRAIIFSRWGQKLYEWNDPTGGWDGKYNGHPVKEGVYYVLVRAKGADGKEYNIRKDVNLLRGFTEGGNASGRQ